MSDLQQGRLRPGVIQSDQTLPFVVSELDRATAEGESLRRPQPAPVTETESEATVRADHGALAVAVAVGIGASDTGGLLAGLRTKLEQGQDRWLVIIDGLEPDVSLESLLPTQGRGQVLLTCPFEPAGADCVAIGAPSATVAVRALADAGPADAVAEPLHDEALDTLGARLASEPWGLALAARHLASGQTSPGRLAAQLNRPPTVGGLDSSQVTSAAEAALLVVLDAWQRHRPQAVPALLATSMLGSRPLRQTDLDRLAPGGENATTPDQLTSPERVGGAAAVPLTKAQLRPVLKPVPERRSPPGCLR